jgi:hypothetical protein
MLDVPRLSATEHRSRWSAAVLKLWDFRGFVGEIPETLDRPGLHAENVFFFHDGLKLIVSCDRYGVSSSADGATYLHVSASVEPESQAFKKVSSRCKTISEMIEKLSALVRERVRFIAGVDVALGYVTLPRGIPHFFNPPLGERGEG